MTLSAWNLLVLVLVVFAAAWAARQSDAEADRPGIDPISGTRKAAAVSVPGTNSWPGKWPWLGTTYDGSRCVTLLSRRWALTSASAKFRRGEVVVFGVFSLSSPGACRQVARVAAAYPHQSYNPRTLVNNVCVIKLDRPVRYNCSVRPCRLSKSRSQKLFAVGWRGGALDLQDDSTATVLDSCTFALNLDLQFCAKSTCVGSEGCGLYSDDGDGRFSVTGVFCAGDSACKYGYTDASRYANWIYDRCR